MRVKATAVGFSGDCMRMPEDGDRPADVFDVGDDDWAPWYEPVDPKLAKKYEANREAQEAARQDRLAQMNSVKVSPESTTQAVIATLAALFPNGVPAGFPGADLAKAEAKK